MRIPPEATNSSLIHIFTQEGTVLTELQDASKQEASKENRVNGLRRARELLDGLLARGASGDSKEDLKEFTEALSIVVNMISQMEIQDRVNSSVDFGTDVTSTESVVSSEIFATSRGTR
jgi:hypothetical protein